MGDPTTLTEAAREAIADHFVMWQELGPQRGDWRCGCGLKFGFSDSAIDHVAAEVAARLSAASGDDLRNRVAAVHCRTAMHPHESDCLLPDEHRDEWDFDGEFCPECPPNWFACATCRDQDGAWVEWPCETADVLAASSAPVVSRPEAEDEGWVDKHGDVWHQGDDGLMHTRETAPFPRDHVERKWGPLRRAASLAADPTSP